MNIPGFIQCTYKCLLEILRELLQVVPIDFMVRAYYSVIDDIIVQ